MGVGPSAVESLGLAPDPTFWQGCRVFLTGHTGFKGAWLALWLQRLGAAVTGYSADIPTSPSLFELGHVARGMRSVEGDIRDRESLTFAMRQSHPQVVIHFAAQSTVGRGYALPILTYETNVLGTVNVLEAIRETGVARAALIVTSDKCYRGQDGVHAAHREDEALGGLDPYSSSKACAELAVAAYRASYFTGAHLSSVATARAGNVFGGGDWTLDRLLPDLMRAFGSGKPAQIRNVTHVRPWQHVLDALCGYLLLLERLTGDGARYGEAWNFGPLRHEAVSVAELATRAADLWGEGASWEPGPVPSAPAEVAALALDSSKAAARLGWRPRLDLDTALRWTVEWHKGLSRGISARALTEAQIAAYIGKADRPD